MRFSAKLAMGCLTLLAGALCAAGLALVGCSFSDDLQSTRATLQTQQTGMVYAVESSIFTTVPDLAERTLTGTDQYWQVNSQIASAAQTYAEQTGLRLACWVEGKYSIYSNLPQKLPMQIQREAIAAGSGQWRLVSADGPAADHPRRAHRHPLRL